MTPNEDHLLSSFLDQELSGEELHAADAMVKEQFEAQVQYRNMSTVSKACQENLDPPQSGGDDFLGSLFSKIEHLEQENPAEDLECLSAWVDSEFELTPDELETSEVAEVYAQQTHALQLAMQDLPMPAFSENFAERVMQRIDAEQTSETEDSFAPIAQAMQQLEVPVLSEDFANAVMNRIEVRENEIFAPVQQALQDLSVPALSENFAHQLMARIDAETTAAAEDPFAPVAEALQSLPVPELSSDFVLKVMMATESVATAPEGPKLFALPLRQRWGQMVAAIAIFGVLLLVSQNLQTSETTVAQTVPSDFIVQVEYAPEAELFDDVMDTPLENSVDDDYTLLIGG